MQQRTWTGTLRLVMHGSKQVSSVTWQTWHAWQTCQLGYMVKMAYMASMHSMDTEKHGNHDCTCQLMSGHENGEGLCDRHLEWGWQHEAGGSEAAGSAEVVWQVQLWHQNPQRLCWFNGCPLKKETGCLGFPKQTCLTEANYHEEVKK